MQSMKVWKKLRLGALLMFLCACSSAAEMAAHHVRFRANSRSSPMAILAAGELARPIPSQRS